MIAFARDGKGAVRPLVDEQRFAVNANNKGPSVASLATALPNDLATLSTNSKRQFATSGTLVTT